MSAATLTRTTRSAYPTAVEELIPLAREYAAELGVTPTRNQLKTRFRIGAPKARTLLSALQPEPIGPEPTGPEPTGPEPTGPEPTGPQRPIIMLEDEGQKYFGAVTAAPPGMPDGDAEPAPVVIYDSHGPEFTDLGRLFRPEPAPTAVADELAEVTTATGEQTAPLRRAVTWPVLILCLPAFAAIWAGWVEMGRLTGFGKVTLLPGITDFQIDTAITLPIGVETYAAYALWVWLSGRVAGDARRFARASAIASLGLGALGQVTYHLMNAAHWDSAPWPITALVACIPVAVLGMGAALAHLLHAEHTAV